MPLATLCSFCRQDIDPGDLDPCAVFIETNADVDREDRRSQQIFAHHACLRRATGDVLVLDELSTPRETAAEVEQDAEVVIDFLEAWLRTPDVVRRLLTRPRGAWTLLRELEPGLVAPPFDDVYIGWADDPCAGQRGPHVDLRLVLCHAESVGWDHSVLVAVP